MNSATSHAAQLSQDALRALDVLDTGPEAEFDALVQVAALACDVPISLITLVDASRQWFKANLGLEAVTETPREHAFCAHAVESQAFLEVRDAHADPRFLANPLVTGPPHIRFYAGAPLRLADGACVGSLCVIDRRPRCLTAEQRGLLNQLATVAARAFEGRRAGAIAKEKALLLAVSEARFRTLSQEAPVGVFEVALGGGLVYVNGRFQEMFGLAPQDCLGEGWLARVHPLDLEATITAWRRYVDRPEAGFETAFRLLRPDQGVREVRLRSRPMRETDAQGALLGHVGSVEDVTEVKQLQDFLGRTGRVALIGGWQLEVHSRHMTWSEQTRRLHDVGDDFEPTLDNALSFFPPEARATLEAAVRAGIADAVPWDLDLPFRSATGVHRWVRAMGEIELEHGRPVRLVGALQDITEQRRRQLALSEEQALRLRIQAHAQQTERLLRERSDMLDVLAHEVRQPLNNASAALQGAAMALSEAGNPTASARLAKAQGVMGEVLASIDNNLAVASLLARPQPIERQDTEIELLLALAQADMRAADRERIRVLRETGTRTVSMDLGLMRLGLRNLLANALQHSPSGSTVRIRVADSDEPLALVVDVENEGEPIPETQLATLFMRTAPTTRGRKPARGMGLGLYIVRRVMELHGGAVCVASNRPERITLRLLLVQALDD